MQADRTDGRKSAQFPECTACDVGVGQGRARRDRALDLIQLMQEECEVRGIDFTVGFVGRAPVYRVERAVVEECTV